MASAQPSLANFGIVLTGRLGLRNELLTTFSVGSFRDAHMNFFAS